MNAATSRRLAAAALAFALTGAASCGGPDHQLELRQGTESYKFVITSNPIPPHAREDVIYTVTVTDRKTGQPIETGEGRIFANTRDGARTYDGFVKAPQVGAYSAKLSYVTAEQWAVGIQFHSDASKPLEKTEWMQDVLPERSGKP
ncbi:MAG TPA: hypothetical protein VIJ90_06395 [Gemmatimonadaceae bacterium]|jgi:hypothetical protein